MSQGQMSQGQMSQGQILLEQMSPAVCQIECKPWPKLSKENLGWQFRARLTHKDMV